MTISTSVWNAQHPNMGGGRIAYSDKNALKGFFHEFISFEIAVFVFQYVAAVSLNRPLSKVLMHSLWQGNLAGFTNPTCSTWSFFFLSIRSWAMSSLQISKSKSPRSSTLDPNKLQQIIRGHINIWKKLTTVKSLSSNHKKISVYNLSWGPLKCCKNRQILMVRLQRGRAAAS